MAETEQRQDTGIEVLAPVIEKYVFAKKLRGDEARDVYKEARARTEKDF